MRMLVVNNLIVALDEVAAHFLSSNKWAYSQYGSNSCF